MADAYEVINDLLDDDLNNVDLQLLAADLAIGGSGIVDAIADLDLENLDTSVEDILATIDLALVTASADHILAAEALDPTAISPDQYLNTGLILLARAAEEAGDFATLSDPLVTVDSSDPGFDTLVDTDRFITLGGGSLSDYGITNSNL